MRLWELEAGDDGEFGHGFAGGAAGDSDDEEEDLDPDPVLEFGNPEINPPRPVMERAGIVEERIRAERAEQAHRAGNGGQGLQRFLQMVQNDEEDEWDSDEMSDEDEALEEME